MLEADTFHVYNRYITEIFTTPEKLGNVKSEAPAIKILIKQNQLFLLQQLLNKFH